MIEAAPTRPQPIAKVARPGRPIKVLVVDTAAAFGGTLAVVRSLLKHLDRSVIDASLVSACSDGFVSHDFAGDTEVRLLAPRVDYVTLAKWKWSVQKRFRWAPLRRSFELSVMVAELLANVPYLLRLTSLYLRLRLDVVHVNNYSMEPIWAARLLRIPIVYQIHGVLPNPLGRTGRRNFRHVHAFISVSHGVTQSAIGAGIDREKIHYIPNFVERTHDGSPSPLPAEPAIGIFGRVNYWKGHKEFLRAAIQVLPRFPKLRVYVVGDASDADPKYLGECLEIARSSGFADQFQFTGLVTNVGDYYRKCTVVVLASIGPEGFPMVLLEAMAQARPVIGSIVGTSCGIIDDGIDGFVVDPKDTHSLAERISELLVDPTLATRMGQRGYEKVRAEYEPGAAARKYESLYLQIAGSKVKSPR